MELVRPASAVLSKTAERSVIDEDEFLLLYERTARHLRAYLYRMLNDISRADDILQETYLRFLRAQIRVEMTEAHRKNYLFRIATNLLRDEGSTRKDVALADCPCPSDIAAEVSRRNDCTRFLAQLPGRQRQLLWLAYVEGFTHDEIAQAIGVKTPSIRPMLARARESLSEILKAGGFRKR